MRCIMFAIFIAGLLVAAPAKAAYDIFFCVQGVAGETLDSGFPGCMDVLSVSNAGFVEAGVAEPRDLRYTGYVEAANLVLRGFMVSRGQMPEGTFWFRRSGTGVSGPSGAHMSIKLEEFSVSSMAGGTSGGEDRATETVSLAFQRIEYMYRRQLGTGSLAQPTYTCWDVPSGTAFSGRC